MLISILNSLTFCPFHLTVEATTGEADLTGLSTLVSMLANASLTKSNEGDKFRCVIVDSLRQYQKGDR